MLEKALFVALALLILLTGCSAVPSVDCTHQNRHNDGPPRVCWVHTACLDGSERDSKPAPCEAPK